MAAEITRELAILAGVEGRSDGRLWSVRDSLEELGQLAGTAGIQVGGRLSQRMPAPSPATYLGAGKLQELRERIAGWGSGAVIFDDELSPAQQRNIERVLGQNVKVLDRTALILDIFAQHAHTREGQIQVELAQYEYRLPRLTGMWTHLIRQAGGRAAGGVGVGLRGPGETQLETDRRVIRRRIAALKRQLEEVRQDRQHRSRRRRERGLRTVALVGYTNAGKSSLLNALCGAAAESATGITPAAGAAAAPAYVADQLFATLDPMVRRVRLPAGTMVLLSDTVGFIHKLPHELVAAFRATLEGVQEADLLLHVVDSSHPRAEAQVRTVQQVLAELHAADKPTLLVRNKIDLGEAPLGHPPLVGSVPASALTGEGMELLLDRIEAILKGTLIRLVVDIPYDRGHLQSLIFSLGIVEELRYREASAHIEARVPGQLAAALAPYRCRENRRPAGRGRSAS